MDLVIHTDGGSRGNPGEGAVGVLVETKQGQILARFGKRIGVVTNNEAEYQGVIEALTWIRDNITKINCSNITMYLDSKVVCNQLRGIYKVKKAHLGKLIVRVRSLENEINIPVLYNYVSRENNSDADALVNQALDAHLY